MGSDITTNCVQKCELEKRIQSGNKGLNALCNLLRDKNIIRKTEEKIFTTIVRPVVTNASETRIVLRRICGAVKENEQYRRRTKTKSVPRT